MAGDKNNNFSTRGWAALTATAAALLLSACATTPPPPDTSPLAQVPQQPAEPVVTARQAAARETLRTMVNLQDRLYRVAAPILINNAELCRTQARNLLGFTAKNRWSYPGDYNEASAAVLNYDDVLQVSGVLPGSGAARAGLRKGDDLLAADGKPLPTGRDAESKAAAVFGPLVSNRASLNMTIARNGSKQQLNVPVTRACAIRVDLGNSDNINSYADGARVLVTRGMINFAQSDEHLAYVLAKDIAHNVLGHSVTMRNNAAIGSIIDNLASVNPDLNMLIGTAGLKPYSLEMDIAADNLALYMLARAGYQIDKYKAFWQRVYQQYPPTVLNGYSATHPNATGRMGPIDKTVAEIKSKHAAKRPLTP